MAKRQIITENYALYNDDCCKVLPQLPDESIGFCIFSPPFSSLYSYSDDTADMCNNKTYEQFFDHFAFLLIELNRIMQAGRSVSVHCMDLPLFKKDGKEIALTDFPGDIIRAFLRHGFVYHSRVCIWKDPLIAAIRTKAIGLSHGKLIKDSYISRNGIADYVITMRKKGENKYPISHKNGLTTYYGERQIPNNLRAFEGTKDQRKNKLSQWIWQQYASPVWFDIRQTRVLNYKAGREEKDERHICALQLDVIERCMELWATESDTVLTPFMGVGSEVCVGVSRGLKAIGIELKESYYKQAVRNVKMYMDNNKIGLK